MQREMVSMYAAHQQAELQRQAVSQQLTATETRAAQLSDHAVSVADLPHQLANCQMELAAVTTALKQSRSVASAAELRSSQLTHQVRPPRTTLMLQHQY